MKVNEAIEILKTMPQEAEIVASQNGGGCETVYSIHTAEVTRQVRIVASQIGGGCETVYPIHTAEVTSQIRDVKLTVVVIDVE
jgi:hypothetical protein